MIEPVKRESSFVKLLDSCLPVFTALASILAVKCFLLFAIVGAFILAQTAMTDTTFHGMYVLMTYCGLTIIPLVWLDVYGKPRGK